MDHQFDFVHSGRPEKSSKEGVEDIAFLSLTGQQTKLPLPIPP